MAEGLTVLFSIVTIIFVVYSIFITVDAIRRPSNQYKTGNKSVWVLLLISTNPLINVGKILGGLFAIIGLIIFITTAIAYHKGIRLGKSKDGLSDQATPEEAREERMRNRFASRES